MPDIHVLSAHLVNKIAAGEVIERPASIVKELVENSLDAGATRIDVTADDGGRKLIAVTDNGAGMSAADLALAFVPHATSKITSDEDLSAIGTMGFRGEALASIASVSRAHVRTHRKDDPGGCEVSAAGNTTGDVRPCPAGVGTTVTVRELFFNTPARRKFLRAAGTEMGHVSEQLARLALPHPQVAFTLTHNGRQVRNLPPAASTAQRVADLLGAELGASLLPIAARSGDVSIDGLIAPPAAARSSGQWQYFFINGRYIRDRVLTHALREAYRGLLDARSWPVAFIFIRIDPAEVDANVHPTKIEVRFRDSRAVHGELLASLRETLNRANLTPSASLEEPRQPACDQAEQAGSQDHRASIREALADFFKSAPPPQPRLGFGESTSAGPPPPHDRPPMQGHAAAPHQGDEGEPAPPIAPELPEALHSAIQLHNAYIVTADEDGLVIIDQHALHERLLYNDLKKRLADADGSPLSGQRLLIPQTLQVTDAEAKLLEEKAALLSRLGIEVAPFGPQTLAVQQFPTLLIDRGAGAGEFIREIIDKLREDETTDTERLLEDLLEMLACKAAVKAGDRLTDGEIQSLLNRREEAEKASACPHGRPTALKITLKDLEKQFKRA